MAGDEYGQERWQRRRLDQSEGIRELRLRHGLGLRARWKHRGCFQGVRSQRRRSMGRRSATATAYSSFLQRRHRLRNQPLPLLRQYGRRSPAVSEQWQFQHALAWSDTTTGDILNDVYGYRTGTDRPRTGASSNWNPDLSIGSYTGQYQAGWSVEGNADYVVYGGEFPSVNGVGQQGLVRFAAEADRPGQGGSEVRQRHTRPDARARSRPQQSGSAGRPVSTGTTTRSPTGSPATVRPSRPRRLTPTGGRCPRRASLTPG